MVRVLTLKMLLLNLARGLIKFPNTILGGDDASHFALLLVNTCLCFLLPHNDRGACQH